MSDSSTHDFYERDASMINQKQNESLTEAATYIIEQSYSLLDTCLLHQEQTL